MTDTLRQRIAAALAAAVTLPGATPNAEEQVVLDDLTDAVLPLVAAETAAMLRIVTDWCIEANEYGGVDAGDLAYRLESAGYPLPDDDEDARADAEDGAR